MIVGLPQEFWNNFTETTYADWQVCANCLQFVKDTRMCCCEKMRRFPYPRQDQLQEMIGKNETPFELAARFHRWWANLTWPYADSWGPKDPNIMFTSMEQLWLAFVMQEKHNKVWDGEKWKTKTRS